RRKIGLCQPQKPLKGNQYHVDSNTLLLTHHSPLQTTVELTAMNPVGLRLSHCRWDYIIWSLFSLVYSNPFCLGLVALIYSVKSRDRKVAGDLEGARSYGTSARFLNIVAIVLSATGFLMFIVIYCTLYYNINRHYY
uniref:Uncharacterized protein n=1 Tax=Seriola dumerili TaxID=41447 RepID=A0A3B4VRM9_SERDU